MAHEDQPRLDWTLVSGWIVALLFVCAIWYLVRAAAVAIGAKPWIISHWYWGLIVVSIAAVFATIFDSSGKRQWSNRALNTAVSVETALGATGSSLLFLAFLLWA